MLGSQRRLFVYVLIEISVYEISFNLEKAKGQLISSRQNV